MRDAAIKTHSRLHNMVKLWWLFSTGSFSGAFMLNYCPRPAQMFQSTTGAQVMLFRCEEPVLGAKGGPRGSAAGAHLVLILSLLPSAASVGPKRRRRTHRVFKSVALDLGWVLRELPASVNQQRHFNFSLPRHCCSRFSKVRCDKYVRRQVTADRLDAIYVTAEFSGGR